MKNLIKVLLVAVALLIPSVKADTFSTNNLAASTNHTILTSPLILQSITLWSTNTSPTTVKFFDNWATSTNTAWTNLVVSVAAVVTNFVTSSGVTNSFTNTVQKVTSTAHAAAIVVPTPILTVTVPASGVLVTLDDPIFFTKRLTLDVSAAGLSFNMSYRNP